MKQNMLYRSNIPHDFYVSSFLKLIYKPIWYLLKSFSVFSSKMFLKKFSWKRESNLSESMSCWVLECDMLGKAFKKVSKAIKKQLCQASFPNGFCKYIHGTYYNHERSREEQRLSLPPSLASSKKILSIYSTHNQLSFLSFLIITLLQIWMTYFLKGLYQKKLFYFNFVRYQAIY